eukprot:scaffold598987_cov18-Prasinocladus_malaysianus.AAC.1
MNDKIRSRPRFIYQQRHRLALLVLLCSGNHHTLRSVGLCQLIMKAQRYLQKRNPALNKERASSLRDG